MVTDVEESWTGSMREHPQSTLRYGSLPCDCSLPGHVPKLVAITGGPGAGKTAVLELATRSFCRHVAVLPEAASIVFSGGFPRHETEPGRRSAQRAIYRLQREVERLVIEEEQVAVALCDRGTIDGLAYWPDPPESFWSDIGSDLSTELARYSAVIHLGTPDPGQGYTGDVIRVESARQAAQLDQRIYELWADHPDRTLVPPAADFATKALAALELIRSRLPGCCRSHRLYE
ncbi:MAG TPA: ATP-binding protein [Acidimicrobiia bacterium]|nr:ATP-binding protein [Acidimicrobiia bacterium]